MAATSLGMAEYSRCRHDLKPPSADPRNATPLPGCADRCPRPVDAFLEMSSGSAERCRSAFRESVSARMAVARCGLFGLTPAESARRYRVLLRRPRFRVRLPGALSHVGIGRTGSPMTTPPLMASPRGRSPATPKPRQLLPRGQCIGNGGYRAYASSSPSAFRSSPWCARRSAQFRLRGHIGPGCAHIEVGQRPAAPISIGGSRGTVRRPCRRRYRDGVGRDRERAAFDPPKSADCASTVEMTGPGLTPRPGVC